jgi:hypothetical protein
MKRIWLRVIYATHMLAPLQLVAWHLSGLDAATARALRSLFP